MATFVSRVHRVSALVLARESRKKAGVVQTILALVVAGLGVAMVPASLRNLKRPGVVYRELPPADTQEVCLAQVWRKDAQSPVVEGLVEIAREAARTYPAD